ncbi:hypothetical protein C7S18_15380 [Ahniella affigens]|uniref:Outer membrane lipoprotein-sorting protein n=2 Tax=Ahniella affigens TaxID=2021234 RepID=A0A2P1PUI7_9GAMM|nr:hypothetical protein C7S18_15380 [Ahniella affigens]
MLVLWLAAVSTVSLAAKPPKGPETWKPRQVVTLIRDQESVRAAKAALASASERFAELAVDGAAASVQWMPDGRTMALGRNEYSYGTTPIIREMRPNYIAVGDRQNWCYVRKAETKWICESPGYVSPALVEIDWQAVTGASVQDEPCGETQCLRVQIDGLVAIDPKLPPAKRRYFRDTSEHAFSVSLLINKADHRPISLLRLDRISSLREGSTDLKFDLDATIEPIALPKNGQDATPF